MVAADHLEKAVNGTTTGEAHHDEKANGSGKAKPFPPSSQWTSKVPVDTQVYGKKTVDCSDEEWRVRVDLTAAYRQCYRMGLCEGINNHLTAAVPGTTNRFLVFPFGLRWCEVTASSLLVVDADGKVLSGKGEPEATAFYIHAHLHQKHPKGMAVFHTHQTWITALSALEDPSLVMCHQNSLRFYKDLAYDSYNGLVLDDSEGKHLAKVMGDKRILIHRNHGVIVCGETVAQCFDDLYYLERAAKVQVLAMSTGKPLHIVDEEICDTFKTTFERSGVKAEYARLHMESLKREMLASQLDKDFIS
jgi:ribulose-5-phosphate 4-epimerase/fuculose-1-phosphate aldolase